VVAELFDFAAEKLERSTPLDQLESRGTLRIALKSAGLDPRTVTPEQLSVVLERRLPQELEERGVAEAAAVCRAVIAEVEAVPDDQWDRSGDVDRVFARLAGS